MQDARCFGVAAPGQDKVVAVCKIAQEYLDKAPDSLLSIASRVSPEVDVIGLTSWPQPSAAVLKVIWFVVQF